VLDKRLRERDIGELQGLTWPEVEARYPELAQTIRQRRAVPALPGGESPFQLAERVWQAVERITHGHAPGASVAVVSHGGALNAYFNRLVGRDDDMPFMFRLDNTSLSMVDIQDGRTRVTVVNSLCHLEQSVLKEEET
jgi:probable phosphoglycerate mutase